MRQEDAFASEFPGVAAGNEIDEEASVADAVERRSLTGELRRRREAGPKRCKKTEALGMWRERGRNYPWVLAMRADRDQRAAEAEPVGCLRDLFQIVEVGRPCADVAAEIGPVAGNRNKPENIERGDLSHWRCSLLFSVSGVGFAVPDDVAHDDRGGDQAQAVKAVRHGLLLDDDL